MTGTAIIRDIVAGEHDPHKLAQHRNPHCAKSEAEITKSLEGHYQAEHLFALKQALQAYDFFQQQIKDCDVEMKKLYAAFEPQVDISEKPLKERKRRRRKPEGNEPDFNLRLYLYQMAGIDLTQIDGINALTVQTVLSEIGVDVSNGCEKPPSPAEQPQSAWKCRKAPRLARSAPTRGWADFQCTHRIVVCCPIRWG